MIFQIILTIIAFTRGWKYKALAPMFIGIMIGFLLGFMHAAFGWNIENTRIFANFLDAGIFGFLIYMSIFKPKEKQ